MTKIRVKNFASIKEGILDKRGHDSWIEIKKVTIFIGSEGSGMSALAKLISTLTWIEKALVRGDYPEREFTTHNRFKKKYYSYHKLENYFKGLDGEDKTEIEYVGDAYKLTYKKERFSIEKQANNEYALPQVMYIPAERNFISTIDNPKMIKLSSGPLVEFLAEFDNAKTEIKGPLQLPINRTTIEYDRSKDLVHVKGADYKVSLTEVSSGYQSSVPLFLVSRHLAFTVKRQAGNSQDTMSSDELKRFRTGVEAVWSDKDMTEEQRRVALSALSSRFRKTAFINIVEEPEQNLYPTSQRQMLNSLLEFTNISPGNKLVMTTHSPYIISYLTLAIKAASLLDKIDKSTQSEAFRERLNHIVPTASCITSDEAAIYELTEDGSIVRLSEYEGIPSDNNFLNQKLAESNELFDALLEIEEEI